MLRHQKKSFFHLKYPVTGHSLKQVKTLALIKSIALSYHNHHLGFLAFQDKVTAGFREFSPYCYRTTFSPVVNKPTVPVWLTSWGCFVLYSVLLWHYDRPIEWRVSSNFALFFPYQFLSVVNDNWPTVKIPSEVELRESQIQIVSLDSNIYYDSTHCLPFEELQKLLMICSI